jgi:hypothetical protein
MVHFVTKGRGPSRRIIPIEERRMPERWRETGVVAVSKRMRIPEIERRAEMLASDSRPVKLIAIRSRTDGFYDAYMRSFSNRHHAESIARRLRKSGFDVGVSTVRYDGKGRMSGLSMDINRGGL